ncbi:MAG: nitrilase-related carbon-nitrogen hydrolase [Gemmatimonadota bacterium]
MRHSVTVRVVQDRPALGDLAANLVTHRRQAEAAAADGAELIVFPELSLTGYALGDLVAAVALDDGDPRWAEVCALSAATDVVAGFVERGADGYLYNAAGYFHGGAALHVHRKAYLPTYGAFDEGRFFSPGRTFEVFDAPWGRGALLICEECWHPAVAHAAAMRGADVLIAISNAPGRGPVDGGWVSQRAWREIVATYARLYGVWVPFASRVGYEEGMIFAGGSAVFAPDGSAVASAGFLDPEELTAFCDAGALRRVREASPAHGIERHELLVNALTALGAVPPRVGGAP